jgi:hypothetical protein
MPATSTWSIAQHLESDRHRICSPGLTTPSAMTGLNSYLEAVHPLQAEHWLADFMNWITHDDISFEKAASLFPNKGILGAGPEIKHLLPCARTVRSWVLSTYNERIADVENSLAGARSKIIPPFDARARPPTPRETDILPNPSTDGRGGGIEDLGTRA